MYATHACRTLDRLLRNMPLTLTCFDYGPRLTKAPTKFFFLLFFSKNVKIFEEKKIYIFFHKCSNLYERCGMC